MKCHIKKEVRLPHLYIGFISGYGVSLDALRITLRYKIIDPTFISVLNLKNFKVLVFIILHAILIQIPTNS
jgi:hypothetical protein